MKVCIECEQFLEIHEFGKLKTAKDGHRNQCKQCYKEKYKERMASDPALREKRKKQRTAYMRRLRAEQRKVYG
jgi:hypothetical protein